MLAALLLLLATDATGRLTFEERGRYFTELERVAESDRAELKAEAQALFEKRRATHEASEPTAYSQFADLLDNPEFWVGKPVCLTGHANLIQTYDPGDNDIGLNAVYETWIVGEDSDRYPSIVISQALPDGVRVGERAVGGLEACGVFFKLLTYKARDGKSRYAPLILTESIGFAEPATANAGQWALVALAVLFGVSLAWRIVRGMTRKPRRRSRVDGGIDLGDEPASLQ